jgi:arginyl-tRNA synthetase
MRMAKGAFPDADLTDMALSRVKPDLPDDPEVSQLLRLLATWPRVVELAAQAHEPHRVAFYLQEVAAAFHALWTKGKEEATLRFIHEDDLSKTLSHLALVRGVAIVIASGLGVIGVAPVAELRS